VKVKAGMSGSRTFETDILIIGGGIAGLALAALLGRAGMDVRLVEPFPPPPLGQTTASGRTVALMQSSLNVIRATGAWEKISEQSAALKTMRIIDDSAPGRETINSEFNAADIGLSEFGFNIPNALLRAALHETVQAEKNVHLHTPATLAGYKTDDNGVKAPLEDGTHITARLIVGADGRNSAVRTMASIDCKIHAYEQSAITCLINHSQSHNDTATEFHRPSGPLAFVPLPGNQSSVVWVEETGRAEQLIALKKDEFTQALRKAMNEILGGITLETGPECWPLSTLQARKITGPRLALCAEAAHVMSPITAQGLNLSLRDVAALAETIVDAARLGLDPGTKTVLDQYRRRRALDINTRVFGVDAMNRIVSNDLSVVKGLRRLTLKTVETVGPIRKLAMRAGLAPEIDQGRLTKSGTL
jgi:2-octaprenyl-6-methoxyphenol hydroxylase